jgi:hypothetical protein
VNVGEAFAIGATLSKGIDLLVGLEKQLPWGRDSDPSLTKHTEYSEYSDSGGVQQLMLDPTAAELG